MPCLGGERSSETGPCEGLSWQMAIGEGKSELPRHRQQPKEAYFESCPTQSVVFLGSV